MTKKTERKSKTAEPARTTRKLTLKKDTLKDLTAPSRGQQVKGGVYRSSGGGGTGT